MNTYNLIIQCFSGVFYARNLAAGSAPRCAQEKLYVSADVLELVERLDHIREHCFTLDLLGMFKKWTETFLSIYLSIYLFIYLFSLFIYLSPFNPLING